MFREDAAITTATVPADDRTARARIRDAAIACFADGGVAGTSVRTIAATADVSPALVIHHFGTKDALRVACDEHVATIIREGKQEAMGAGLGSDPLAAMREASQGPPFLRYLARTLVDGSPHVAELVDELVHDAGGYLQQGIDNGVLRPAADPEARAAVLTVWSLGALVLHEHLHRLIGVDLTGDVSKATRYIQPALEMFSDGLLTEQAAARFKAAFAGAEASAEEEVEGS